MAGALTKADPVNPIFIKNFRLLLFLPITILLYIIIVVNFANLLYVRVIIGVM
jgi:hypothetical protein